MARRDLVNELEGNFQKFKRGSTKSEFSNYNNDDENSRKKTERRRGVSVFKVKGGLS